MRSFLLSVQCLHLQAESRDSACKCKHCTDKRKERINNKIIAQIYK